MKTTQISDLPDYPALKQVADSLWECGDTRGAAIMVGAGFSRNAVLPSPTSQRPPLWSDFSSALETKLYPNKTNSPTRDPLKLAEEYKAEYGTPSLEGLIRNLVTDEQWEPGPLHKTLIELPWKDILTTNWDTLLERASTESLTRNYEIVRIPSDIARTSSPRIVKLHGSLPSHTPFIFSEEDYRTYPTKFSPFVNLVRQALLENDLCLLGFSGEDPNFAEWAGWVRDELGNSARRIFLIGVLNITPTKRRYLEARYITPIDLTPLFENSNHGDIHAQATQLVLNFFHESKPSPKHHWPSSSIEKSLKEDNVTTSENGISLPDSQKSHSDPQFAAQRIRIKLPHLITLRQSYPEWIICPKSIRHQLKWCIDSLHSGLSGAIQYLSTAESAQLLYNITWVHDVAFWPLPENLLPHLVDAVEGKFSSELSGQERSFIAYALLLEARENSKQSDFERWKQWLEKHHDWDSENQARAAYEQCFQAKEQLDFECMVQNVSRIKGLDPIWQLRRASIYAELGDFKNANELIIKTTQELQIRHAKDQNSIWTLSRLGWAAFLSRALKWETLHSSEDAQDSENAQKASQIYMTGDWPTLFKESKCDPWDELNAIDDDITRALEDRQVESQTLQPKFDAGHFSDSSNTVRFSSWTNVPSWVELRRLMNTVGLPVSLRNIDISKTRIIRTISLTQQNSLYDYFALINILSRSDEKIIQRYFGRVHVARLNQEIVHALASVLKQAISFGEKRFIVRSSGNNSESFDSHWVSRVSHFLELLSRLAVRLPSNEAMDLFRETCGYLANPNWNHWWLFEGLGNLAKRSLEAIDPADRANCTIDILNLPVPCELNLPTELHWPELINDAYFNNIKRDPQSPVWTKRISELINIAKTRTDSSRNISVLRLTHLHINNLLTDAEQVAFAEALWGQHANERVLPANTNIFPHVFLLLPEPSPGLSKQIFSKRFYEKENGKGQITDLRLTEIQRAALLKNGHACLPTVEQAENIIAEIIEWQPPQTSEIGLFQENSGKAISKIIGRTIAEACLPLFTPNTWSQEKTNQLVSWIENSSFPSALTTLPELVRLDQNTITWAQQKLQRGLVSRERDTIHMALYAVSQWAKFVHKKALANLPSSLVRAIVGIISNRRYIQLHFALHIARELTEYGFISDDDASSLIDGLDDLWHETNYQAWDETNPETHCLSFIRGNCVRLSHTLSNKGHNSPTLKKWIDEAKLDADPEVRFALETVDA